MRVHLKRAACLGGYDYKQGHHEMPDSVASHWFFLALVASGSALITGAPASKPVAVDEEKLKADPEPEMVAKPLASPVFEEAPVVEEQASEEIEEQAPVKKSKKRK